MHVYRRNPIDFWPGWLTEQEYLANLEARYIPGDVATKHREYYERLGAAKALARRLGWEGDMREGPYIAGFPGRDGHDDGIIIAWKQDNNGDTFVVSPEQLPWAAEWGDPFRPSDRYIHSPE